MLAEYETEVTFPPGAAGILFEPVIRCGSRATGARVVGFSPMGASDATGLISPTGSSEAGAIASEHVNVGSVLVLVDDVCTKTMSFDRIMVSVCSP